MWEVHGRDARSCGCGTTKKRSSHLWTHEKERSKQGTKHELAAQYLFCVLPKHWEVSRAQLKQGKPKNVCWNDQIVLSLSSSGSWLQRYLLHRRCVVNLNEGERHLWRSDWSPRGLSRSKHWKFGVMYVSSLSGLTLLKAGPPPHSLIMQKGIRVSRDGITWARNGGGVARPLRWQSILFFFVRPQKWIRWKAKVSCSRFKNMCKFEGRATQSKTTFVSHLAVLTVVVLEDNLSPYSVRAWMASTLIRGLVAFLSRMFPCRLNTFFPTLFTDLEIPVKNGCVVFHLLRGWLLPSVRRLPLHEPERRVGVFTHVETSRILPVSWTCGVSIISISAGPPCRVLKGAGSQSVGECVR